MLEEVAHKIVLGVEEMEPPPDRRGTLRVWKEMLHISKTIARELSFSFNKHTMLILFLAPAHTIGEHELHET